jgi:hypothetical protein
MALWVTLGRIRLKGEKRVLPERDPRCLTRGAPSPPVSASAMEVAHSRVRTTPGFGHVASALILPRFPLTGERRRPAVGRRAAGQAAAR